MYDLRDTNKAPVLVAVPETILSTPTVSSTLQIIDWSANNRHFLVQRKAKGINEYIMVDRERPQLSLNINNTLGVKPAEVSIRDKHPEKVYFLDSLPGTLRSADLKTKTISAPLLSEVYSYKTYDENLILYSSKSKNTPKGKIDLRIFENDKSFNLRSVDETLRPLLQIERYDNNWYYVIGSPEEDNVFVYENPLPALKREIPSPLIVAAIMRLEDPQYVSFSKNGQYIALQNGIKLLTIDLYDRHQYSFTLKPNIPKSYQLQWMDGHRLIYTFENQAHIIDFDGSNEQSLAATESAKGPFFDQDFENLYSLSSSTAVKDAKAFVRTRLLTN
ncbi:MAG: hypothetical protein M3Q14_00935, partial [bacterium]|nr:hypothetical protein [bacterium]